MYKSVNYHTGGIVTTKMVRSSKRSTKSSAEQIHSLHPAEDGLGPKPEEDETGPGEHSFIYSPSRRRTRGKPCVQFCHILSSTTGFLSLCCVVSPTASRAESPEPHEESAAPFTRSRRRVANDASVAAPHVSVCAFEIRPLE